MRDYYDVLGVGREATQDDIKKRFRQLARDSHPDANPEDPNAEERFREVAQAYEVLSDPQKRAAYDRGETLGGDLFSQFAGLDEILQQFFGGAGFGFGGVRRGGPRRGRDIGTTVELSLDEAASGVSREVAYLAAAGCTTCAGSGAAPGSSPTTCPTCGGVGQVQVSRSTFLGSMMTVTECTTCRGLGNVVDEPCGVCRGAGRVDDERVVAVEIPAGVDDGTRLRLSGRGGAGERGAPPGDLYVEVRIAADERFTRLGDDLHHKISLGLSEATLGAEVTVPLIGGDSMDLDIPSGTQPGTVFRLNKHGMPRLRRRGRGDLLVEVEVAVPTELTKEQEEALRRFGELHGESPASHRRKRRFRAG
ncbi:MAG TPA: molecular chaperone DnaJ [Acidimicrobiia bacterium]|jgi:molecular chaperone DnaJ|nr:molecular chaperone DnaJ [Acidimicrobiia bacterium]